MDRIINAPRLHQTFPHGSIYRVPPRNFDPHRAAVNLGLLSFAVATHWAVIEIAIHVYRALSK
jgi:hypothetical protein